jgi:hypothetical protein
MPEHDTILSKTPAAEIQSASADINQTLADIAPKNPDHLFVQPKLSIGAVDDPLETEADAMADKVMRTPDTNFIQRKCSHCKDEEKMQRKPLTSFLQKKESENRTTASEAVGDQINATRRGGQSMDSNTLSFMQTRFGADFSNVNIHTGNEAAAMNRELNAKAFTVGSDIYFNDGQYQPSSESGKHLLAHELTHTIQQGFITEIQREADGDTKKEPSVNGGLSDEMIDQIVIRLRKAMEGWGTDEEAIYSAFSGRTQEQVDAIATAYRQHYNRSLISDLHDELTDEEMRHLAIFSPTAVGGDPNKYIELIAIQLRDAMKGWGTDETSIMGALTGRTEAERLAIKKAYKDLTQHDLLADLKDELSGGDLITALRLIEQGYLTTEDQIAVAVTGLGTDEESLMAALRKVKGDRQKILALIDTYREKGYGDMLKDISDDLSFSDFDQAMEMLHGETPSGKCTSGQRNDALEAISEAVSIAQNAINKLWDNFAKGTLSNDVRNSLNDNFNPGKAPGAVDLSLARKVVDVLVNARLSLLLKSRVNCGDISSCNDPDKNVLAWTHMQDDSLVQLCSSFFSNSNKSLTILHEFVHHTGHPDHKMYRHVAGYTSLTPKGDGSDTDSLDIADCYAQFAWDLW